MQVITCLTADMLEDLVFKALADPTRPFLLDRLRQKNGQTLGELCEHLEMARQSASQHLDVLEDANLVTTVRRGREKLHYLNPVPIHDVQERWIDKFEPPRLRALSAVGTVLEAEPPRRLVITFGGPGDEPAGGSSQVTFDLEPHREIVRLAVTHENLALVDGLVRRGRRRQHNPPASRNALNRSAL